jgi:phosphatidylglycerol---prolipoprotein diacylglyceryl transferase
MIPYIAQPVVRLGPIAIHLFGVLVAIAVLVGSGLARRRARTAGLPIRLIDDLFTWTVVGGFLAGHVLDQLFYFPQEVLAHPMRLLRLWDGLSSFGGFLGGIAGATAFLARRRYAGMRWVALDAIAYGFPFGWIFGRLGCFVAFDHPGLATRFVLGERYVDGVVRHNLGLEEALFIAVVAGLFLVLGRKATPAGFFVGLLAMLYAPVRFGLDALRIDDARYFGLTPAQYGAVGLLVVGVGVMTAAFRRGADSPLADRWSVSP